MIKRIATIALLAFIGGAAAASEADPLVYYLHGSIVEGDDPRPVHDRWGVYDYPFVVEALGSQGATVVSEHRAADTDVNEYANGLAAEIKEQIASGVPPQNITVVGFSKGGAIAILVSGLLDEPDVRFVFLAACANWLTLHPDIVPKGRILSIIEKSDRLGGSCDSFAARNENLGSYREISISTGKEHGAFYLPRAVWIDPLLAWIHEGG